MTDRIEKSDRYKEGMETLRKMTDAKGLEMMGKIKAFYPEFEEMMISFGYCDIYSREGLDLKQRELITLSSLITQGAFEQLSFHVNAALRVGLKPKEIVELIVQCAAYAGFPKASTAMAMVMELFAEQEIELE